MFSRRTDLPRLARLVKEHHEKYLAVPEYGDDDTKKLMKPKNHAAVHYAHTISDCGPLREIWCFSLECFNQYFKKVAEISNFKDVTSTMAQAWSMMSAIQLADLSKATWGIDSLKVAAEYCDSDVRLFCKSDEEVSAAVDALLPDTICIRELESRSFGASTLAVSEWIILNMSFICLTIFILLFFNDSIRTQMNSHSFY